MAPCEHKIGMCKCPLERYMFYQAGDARWQPVLVCLLGCTSTREGAWFLEASLIMVTERGRINIDNNINWTTSKDYGGEGPVRGDLAHTEHFVYIALKPLEQ